MARLLRVALTGGIGTGKSYCLERFQDRGAHVLSADAIAREAVAPGAPALESIRRRFGSGVFSDTQTLDRAALARLVFQSPAERHDLERIIHPIVYERIHAWLDDLDAAPSSADAIPVAIVDIPLLYETARHAEFDRVVVAACDGATQLARVMARDGITAEEADRRISAQMPIAEKRKRADFVIDTGGTFADSDRQVDAVWMALLEAAHRT